MLLLTPMNKLCVGIHFHFQKGCMDKQFAYLVVDFLAVFNVWKPPTVFQSDWSSLQIPTNSIWSFHFLPNLLSVVLFFLLQSSQWARSDISLWLICISLMANNSEYFLYAYSIREIALHTLCPDFNCVIWSFVSSCRDYLRIVDTSPLSDAQLVHSF